MIVAECGGIVCVVHPEDGEPTDIASDRAWLIARWVAADPMGPMGRGSHVTVAKARRGAAAWAWWARRGCEYADDIVQEADRIARSWTPDPV